MKMGKDMMIRQRRTGQKENTKDTLRFTLETPKRLKISCSCHPDYEYTLRIDNTLTDKDIENMSNPDFFQWLDEKTGMSYIEYINVHKDFADIPKEERRIGYNDW